jgi:uncharacterized membrane protein YgcG
MITFPRTVSLVGALPRLAPVVADTTGQLKGSVIGKLKRQITRMQRRYPQLVVQVVMHRFVAEHPFQMHAFWIFNAGAFAGEAKRGKNNHAVMVVVDPYRMESAIVPGYGLEPLLQQEALDHLLSMAGPAFESANWELGFTVLLEGLEQLLETVTVTDEAGEAGEY